ncbi:MAG: phosphoribosyl transferase protein [Verrucomicrobia bacterium]|nr:phosphoribosyl transferase protein [Verrucomicrobiota bacterium]
MNLPLGYRDRREAGRVLASVLMDRDLGRDPFVLGLPRGGVPVAAEVAEAVGAPLDVFIVRKIGLPEEPELAMGSLASGGVLLLDRELIARARISPGEVEEQTQREWSELARREELYRPGRPPLDLRRRNVVLIDDGLATGYSLRAAIAALRRMGCARISAGVPVGAVETCAMIEREVDLLVCPRQPRHFRSVGEWYEDFSATDDSEVIACLARAGNPEAGIAGKGAGS